MMGSMLLSSNSSVVQTSRKVGFLQVNRGYICSSCAADYRTVEFPKRSGKWVSVIQTDPVPGFVGVSKIPQIERAPRQEVQMKKGHDLVDKESYRKFGGRA